MRESSVPQHHRPFTRAQLRARKGDLRVLRRRDYVQVFQDAWVHRDGIDPDTRIRAALVIHPRGAFASHFSAARLWDLPVPEHRFEHVTVRRLKDRRQRSELKSHVTKRKRGVTKVRGIPTTDLLTTFQQLAGCLPLVDLVVLGDAIVRKYGVSPRRLLRACQRSTDHYAAAAARAAAYVRKGVDSPMETRLRMLLVLAGLPEPVVDVRIMVDGVLKRRFDLCYPALRLVVEYDGRQHADNTKQWQRDLERREELDDDDYRILVVTARGIYREPERTLERVRRQLVQRGQTEVPPLDEAWRDHFA